MNWLVYLESALELIEQYLKLRTDRLPLELKKFELREELIEEKNNKKITVVRRKNYNQLIKLYRAEQRFEAIVRDDTIKKRDTNLAPIEQDIEQAEIDVLFTLPESKKLKWIDRVKKKRIDRLRKKQSAKN